MHPQSLDLTSPQSAFSSPHNFTYTSASPISVTSTSSHPAPDFPSPPRLSFSTGSSPAPAFAPATRHKNCPRNHSRLHLRTTRDPTTSSTMANLDEANEKQDRIYPVSHQNQPKSSVSSSSITNAKDQSLEVTTAVLNTNELFHLILSKVPHKTSLRRVSKTWQAAIAKTGHTMEPLGYQSIHGFECREVPLYPLEPDIRFIKDGVQSFKINTAFLKKYRMSNRFVDGYRLCSLYYVQGVPDIPALAGHEHEFITDPPVTQVVVDRGWEKRCQAILRVREGIRIGDLVDGFTKWTHEDDAHFGGCVWWAIAKEFGEHTTETDDDTKN